MSKTEQLLRDDLDCLRLASDLTQVASNVPSDAQRAFLLQMARTSDSLVDRLETRRLNKAAGFRAALAAFALAPPFCIALHRG
jgi:hypothetical protein